MGLLQEMQQKGSKPALSLSMWSPAQAIRARCVYKAVERLQGIQQKGLETNVVTFNAASSACVKGKRPG